MTDRLEDLVLLVGGSGFAAYVALKVLTAIGMPASAKSPIRRRIRAAKKLAGDRALRPGERAAALREASQLALEGLARPALAASYARRAQRLDPSDAEAAKLLAAALRRGSRFRALEVVLWRELAERESESAEYQRAFSELVGLYEGPLHRPDTASALRRLKPIAV